jgi:hypothetical protein
MKKTAFPVLENVFGSYLHQDFLCEFAGADEAIGAFAASAPVETIRLATLELDQLIELMPHIHNPNELLADLGAYYDPLGDGLDVLKWLQRVREIFGRRIGNLLG